MSTKISEIKPIAYSCNGKTLTFIKPQVMAIVNLTPDSFYDGGKYDSIQNVLRDVEEKVYQGASIIDVGAASTRPKAELVSEEEEWKRLKTVLPELRKQFQHVFLSMDTYRSGIAKKAADIGVDIINDISGGSLDKQMFKTVAELNLPYVLMHIQGTPQTMQDEPKYKNVEQEVKDVLSEKIKQLHALGFKKIILDPGFGFGKNTTHNFQLLKHLDNFKSLGYPVLAGVSRKSMINNILGTSAVTALNGTTVLNTLALLNGASVLRVHDVTEAKQAVELVEFYKQS